MKVMEVNKHLSNAIKNYRRDDNAFQNSMNAFLKEAKKHPLKAHAAIQSYYIKAGESIDSFGEKVKDAVDEASGSILTKLPAQAYGMAASIGAIEGRMRLTDVLVKAKEMLYSDNDVKNNLNKLYPKTAELRKELGNRLRLESVAPKLPWKWKINLAEQSYFKNLDYQLIYPKTYFLRKKLISSGQVKEGTVTPKASWFKKLKLVFGT